MKELILRTPGTRVRFTATNGREDHGTVVGLNCPHAPPELRGTVASHGLIAVLTTRQVVHLVPKCDIVRVML
jgi:hypothetical protein